MDEKRDETMTEMIERMRRESGFDELFEEQRLRIERMRAYVDAQKEWERKYGRRTIGWGYRF